MYIIAHGPDEKCFVVVTTDPLNTHPQFVTPEVLAKVDARGIFCDSDQFVIMKEGEWNKGDIQGIT